VLVLDSSEIVIRSEEEDHCDHVFRVRH